MHLGDLGGRPRTRNVCVCVGGGQGRGGTEERFLQIISCFKRKPIFSWVQRACKYVFCNPDSHSCGSSREMQGGQSKRQPERLGNIICHQQIRRILSAVRSNCPQYTFLSFEGGFYFSSALWVTCLGSRGRAAPASSSPDWLCQALPGWCVAWHRCSLHHASSQVSHTQSLALHMALG